jgi:hypothetical protein
MYNAYTDGKRSSTQVLSKDLGQRRKTDLSYTLWKQMGHKSGLRLPSISLVELASNAEKGGIII